MSFPKPPVVASSMAMLAALTVVSSDSWARDGQRGGGDVVYEMPPMSADDSREIIYVMPPMKPVKGMAAQTPKPAPKPAEQPAPAIAATPAPQPAKEAAPVQPSPASVAEAPKSAEVQPPVAEAPKPAEQPVAEAAPPAADRAQTPSEGQAPAEQPLPEQPATAAASPDAPAETAQQRSEAQTPDEEAPKSAEAAAPAQPAPAQPPVAAEAPSIVEQAPIGPPVMTFNPPRKTLAALKEPAAGLDARAIQPREEVVAPALVPQLRSTAKAPEQQPAPIVAEQPAPEAGAAAPVDAQASTDGAATAAADADARIGALLAEGVAGPAEVRIGDRATMWLPAGRTFIPLEPARKLAKEAGLEWRAGVQGIVAPSGGKLQWLAPVELLDDGYIKIGEPDALEPEKLLAAFEASLPEVNEQRARVGQPPVSLGGWLSPPKLTDKRRLSACVNVATQNDRDSLDRFFNCEAWALGREGAIKIGLADAGEEAERLKGEAEALANTIVFDRGKTYEDFDAATDRVAPYVAADMLTRDVAARTASPSIAAEGESGGSIVDILSRLLEPALFAAAALGLYVWLKRRRAGEKDAGTETAEAATTPEPVEEKTPAPSLVERFLPTLHARFARRPAQDAEPSPVARSISPAPAEAPAAASKAEPINDKPASAIGGILAKISSMRAGAEKNAAKTAVRSSAVEKPAANNMEEPVSALRKLAAKMRRSAEEPAAAPVDVSRALRPIRTLPGAAPATAEKLPEPIMAAPIVAEAIEAAAIEPELIEPGAAEGKPAKAPRAAPELEKPVVAAATPPREAAPAKQPVFDEDDFGLVEPGDAEATSAAINASRALREARG